MSLRIVACAVVALVVGVAAGLLIASDEDNKSTGHTDTTVMVQKAAPFASARRFVEPPVIRSRRGRLKVTLVAQTGAVQVSGVKVASTQTYAARTRSGLTRRGILGPTLQVNPGERVEITLDNRLTVPKGVPAPNCPAAPARTATGDAGAHMQLDKAGGPQLTNLHFHGLHVTPRRISPYGDTVLVHLPGGRSRFSFTIPSFHDQGTYWYHAHVHECTFDQVYRGLAGILLIGNTLDNLPSRFKAITTRTLALKDVQLQQPKGSNRWQIPVSHTAPTPTHRTVNGLVNPTMKIRPGETQLWRLANVSAELWYRVAIVKPSGSRVRDPFTVVAQDGDSLRRPARKTSLLMPPGTRFDILVRGPASGKRLLKTLKFDQGLETFPEDILATVDVGGSPARATAPPKRMRAPSQVFPRRRGPTRKIVFDFDTRSPPKNFFQATINNLVFDPRVAGVNPTLWTTERWIIYNKTGEWHPFHIHQDDFRLISSTSGQRRLAGVQDIVALPPGTHAKPSRVVIEMPFTDFAGQFVFHCHILDHEDSGMMSLVNLSRRAAAGR
jgi:FtsP/CotA-like multicopper oxidase with cupredoxin domain